MTAAPPIAIFVYKRPEHTRRMLASLLRNPGAAQRPITVYCDGPRDDRESEAVARARAVVRELAPAHARIVERDRNVGLAGSVIAGVSEVVGEHGTVIVLEDDLEISPVTLDYFDAGLQRYRGEERAMHVAGYMYPVRAALPETFFYREATCYGWATWSRAWRHFEPDPRKILQVVQERGARRDFDIEGSMDFFALLESQIAGRVDSWAIRWYGSVWMRGGLALHPGRSLVRNTGFDGTGEHSGTSALYDVDVRTDPISRFPARIEEDPSAVKAMVAFRRGISRQHLLESLKRRWHQWTS